MYSDPCSSTSFHLKNECDVNEPAPMDKYCNKHQYGNYFLTVQENTLHYSKGLFILQVFFCAQQFFIAISFHLMVIADKLRRK